MMNQKRPKPIALDAYEALAERFAAQAVKYDPIIYGIETPICEETRAGFGSSIEEHGFGHYSKDLWLKARKGMSV